MAQQHGAVGGRSGSTAVAVEKHAAGEAHEWEPCTCGAPRGEQCFSRASGVPRRKKRPCAGRAWIPRRSDDPALDERNRS